MVLCRKIIAVFVLSIVFLVTGCHSDIVCSKSLKSVKTKIVYVMPLDTEIPNVGIVIRDVLQKELIRKKIVLCDSPEKATVILSGAAFFTDRAFGSGKSYESNTSLESVSVKILDRSGNILCSASYDNTKRYTASRLSKELGSIVASKLK